MCVLILLDVCPHTTTYYTAYQTSPLGRTILGTEDNIKNMTRDLITNYIQVLLRMCPQYYEVSSYSYICVLILHEEYDA